MEKFKFYTLVIGLISGLSILQGCGGGGGDTPTNTDTDIGPDLPAGVQLNAIGNRSVSTNNTLSFTISASNPDDHNISFSTDTSHTIYTNQNASFDTGTRQFSWNPSVTGTHQVRFSVTNLDASPPLVDSETITISVQGVLELGAELYVTHCERCHGVGGEQGPSAGIVIGTPPRDVRAALGVPTVTNLAIGQMSVIKSNMSDPVADANAIGFYLCDISPDITDYTDTNQCPVE